VIASFRRKKERVSVGLLKVVPMSQRSGILEWCEGTVPMGEYLIGVNGAHQRYRPDDWKAIDCRRAMSVRCTPAWLIAACVIHVYL